MLCVLFEHRACSGLDFRMTRDRQEPLIWKIEDNHIIEMEYTPKVRFIFVLLSSSSVFP